MLGIDPTATGLLLGLERRGGTLAARASGAGRPSPKDQRVIARHQSKPYALAEPARPDYARLNYDIDAREAVIEVLDPQTGAVFLRLPYTAPPRSFDRGFVSDRGSLIDIYV